MNIISTVDALHKLLEYIVESKRRSIYTYLLTLYIKSVFNSVRRTDIHRLLERLGVEHDHLSLIDDYFWYRSVILHEGEHYFNVEVLQGSCLCPILWLVVIYILLIQLTEEEAWVVQVFADDTFVAPRSPAVKQLTYILAPVLSAIYRWATQCNLEFSYTKSCYTIVPTKGKLKNQPSGRVMR